MQRTAYFTFVLGLAVAALVLLQNRIVAQEVRPAACDALINALQADDVPNARAAIHVGCMPSSRLDGGGATALSWSQSAAMTRALIGEGADVNQLSDLQAGPLGAAVFHQNIDIVKILLAAGAKPDAPGTWECSPICEAMAGPRPGNVDIVRMLLAARASPNSASCTNETAIFKAMRLNLDTTFGDLLASGASTNWYETKGGDPLIVIATAHGRLDTLDALLRAGSNPNWPNSRSCRSALHAAAAAGRSDLVQLLISKGADPTVSDNSGLTPRGAAEVGGHADVAQALASRGVPSSGIPRTDCVSETNNRDAWLAWNNARARTRASECAAVIQQMMNGSGRGRPIR